MTTRGFLLACLVAIAPWVFAQAPLECLPKHGTPGTFVYDFANVLSAEDEVEFNQTIQSLNDTTPNSIVVVTHPDFCGEEPLSLQRALAKSGEWVTPNLTMAWSLPFHLKRRGAAAKCSSLWATALRGCFPMRP